LKSITPDPLHGATLELFRAGVRQFGPRLDTPARQLADLAPKRRALF